MKKLFMLVTLCICLLGVCPQPAQAADDVKFSSDASGFVLLTDVVPDAILEIRYYSTYNFVGDRIDGYLQPTALSITSVWPFAGMTSCAISTSSHTEQ